MKDRLKNVKWNAILRLAVLVVRKYIGMVLKRLGYIFFVFSISLTSILIIHPSVVMEARMEMWDSLWMAMLSAFALIFLMLLKKWAKQRGSHASRESNIELCRVVCMLLIIAHHCVSHGGVLEMEGMGRNKIFSAFLIPGGKLCFDCFLAISCWFLVDQKFRAEKFLKVWAQVLFYSVVFAAVAFGFGAYLSFRDWVSVFLPITGNSHGFAATYLAFYLLLPFLAILSEKVNKRQARWLLALLLYFEVGSRAIGCFTMYYQPLSSELLLFVLFYVLMLNLKKWPLKLCDNQRFLFGVFAMMWVWVWMVFYLYVQNPSHPILQFLSGMMCDESSIINIAGGIALFFFFKNLKMKRYPWINYLSTGTFGILLIHDHNFFRYILWKDLLHTQEWYYTVYFPVIVVAVVIWVYAVGFLIERVRVFFAETFQKHNHILR